MPIDSTPDTGMAQIQRFVLLQKLRKVAVVAAVVFRGVQRGDLLMNVLRQCVFVLSSSIPMGQRLGSSLSHIFLLQPNHLSNAKSECRRSFRVGHVSGKDFLHHKCFLPFCSGQCHGLLSHSDIFSEPLHRDIITEQQQVIGMPN
jgi:hypothetical protein